MSSEREKKQVTAGDSRRFPPRGTMPVAVPSRDPDLLETPGLSYQKLDPASKCQGKQEQRLRELHVFNKASP